MLTGDAAAVQVPGRRAASLMPDQIDHELRLIGELGYAPYFLTVRSIVAESRRRGILCQGRGSAANSCVCFCSASPRSTRSSTNCCSSASYRASARSRPISTSISSMSAAKRSSSGSTRPMGGHRRADRGRHALPHPRRGRRGRQGARPAARSDQDADRARLGLVGGRHFGRADRRASTSMPTIIGLR
jgi:hypothetical protein